MNIRPGGPYHFCLKSIITLLIFVLLAGLLLAPPVRALGAYTVVIIPFENLSSRPEYNWIGESFAEGLAELLDKPGLVAIQSDERNVAYKQEGFPPTAILTRATMIKLAERAGASLVVMGTYRISGEGRESTITVSAKTVNIVEGRLVGREFSRGSALLELQRLQGELAYDILYQSNPALPFSRDQIISQAVQVPIGAFENYIKGTVTLDHDARVSFFEHAIKETADKTKTIYAAAAFELARLKYESGEYKEALELFEKLDQKATRYDEAQFYIAISLDMTGETGKALDVLQKLAQTLPLYEVYNNIGVLFIKKKQYEEALKHLKPAADAAPRDTDVMVNLGYAYYLAKDFANAESVLKKEIDRRPSDGEAQYLLSKALAAKGDSAGANAAADQAKKLLPAYAQWETKGMPAISRMKTAFSKANYYRYRRDQDGRLGPPSGSLAQKTQPDELLQSARDAFSAGRDEEAMSTLVKMLEIAPQSYEAHLLAGRIHERRGDLDRAITALKAALFWNPKLVSAHVLLGRISVLRNDCAGAQVSATKALQLDANDQDAQALRRLVDEKCKGAN